jgi:hypothetical protein
MPKKRMPVAERREESVRMAVTLAGVRITRRIRACARPERELTWAGGPAK